MTPGADGTPAEVRQQGVLQRQLPITTALIDHLGEGVCALDREGRITSLNPAAERLLGWTETELRGKPIDEVLHRCSGGGCPFPSHPAACPLLGVMETGTLRRSEEEFFSRKGGGVLPVGCTSSPIVAGRECLGAVVSFHDATERRRAEEQLRQRVRQQAVVAELGQRALAGTHLTEFLGEAVARVAQTLDAEFGKVLELLPDGRRLLLRAGVGLPPGIVGKATVDAGPDTHPGYTLFRGEPIVVEDLRTETRFSPSLLLQDRGVISGLSVIIPGRNLPFGVLLVQTARLRRFTQDDAYFLQSVAHVLAGAIELRRGEKEIRSVNQELE